MSAHQSFDATTSSNFFFDEEHHLLRAQVRRFVEEEIKPYADRWEEEGHTPREILRKMGDLWLLWYSLSRPIWRISHG